MPFNPAQQILQAKQSVEQLQKTENPNEVVKNINAERKATEEQQKRELINSVKERAKTLMADKTKENRVATLKKQTRNRNIYIAGAMVVGALGGFLIAKSLKTKMLPLVLSAVGGSLVLGVPAILFTAKDAKTRKEEIKSLANV